MRATREETAVLKKLVRPVVFGAVVGAVVCLLILLGLAALLAVQDLPHGLTTPLAITAAGLGSFAGGFLAARMSGEKGWLVGLMCGVILLLMMLIAGGFSMLKNLPGSYLSVKLPVVLLAAMVGGMIGVGSRGRSRR